MSTIQPPSNLHPLTDSHCHLDKLDLTPFNQSFTELFEAARKLGVWRFLCIGIDVENLKSVLDLAEQHPDVYASIGSHPCNENENHHEFDFDELSPLIAHPKVIAIGETGIDYYHQDKPQVKHQQQRFIAHIEAAKQTGKALIIHMRNAPNHQQATDDLLNILKTHGEGKVRGVMHCFAEDIAVAKRALDLGFYISFSGIVTFKNAENLKEVASYVPSDQYLIETDSPWLAPVPYRGKANYPQYVYFVAQTISELRKESLEKISEQTESNFNRLFFLNQS